MRPNMALGSARLADMGKTSSCGRLTCIQDEYSIMGSKHFIGIHGYMLVYSVASRQSFETVRVIIDKILNHLVCLCLRSSPSFLIMQ